MIILKKKLQLQVISAIILALLVACSVKKDTDKLKISISKLHCSGGDVKSIQLELINNTREPIVIGGPEDIGYFSQFEIKVYNEQKKYVCTLEEIQVLQWSVRIVEHSIAVGQKKVMKIPLSRYTHNDLLSEGKYVKISILDKLEVLHKGELTRIKCR